MESVAHQTFEKVFSINSIQGFVGNVWFETIFDATCCFAKYVLKHISETNTLFQVRESPARFNIPTPTPAPDHPLGGHE